MTLEGPSWVNVGLALLPAVLLGLLVPFLVVKPEAAVFHGRYLTLLIVGGTVVSIYALTLVFILLRASKRVQLLTGGLDVLKRRNRTLDGHIRALESEVELLTAMREVSRIASDEVRFEKLVSSVLQVVAELTDAREVTLFLADEASGKLTPRASRVEGKTRVGQNLSNVRCDAAEAARAVEHHTILRTLEMDMLDITVPLAADQGPLGVLHITVDLSETPVDKGEVASNIEAALRDISRHVSLAIKMAALHQRAVHDGATGLYNKEHFLRSLKVAVEEAGQTGATLSLLMLDIDHFKQINDTYGHPTGDATLVQLAKLLGRGLRRSDSAYRFGGEEMAVLLPDAPLEEAAGLAERLRRKVADTTFRGASGEKLNVCVSIGVAELTGSTDDPEELIAASDAALYEAKRTGRNRVCKAG